MRGMREKLKGVSIGEMNDMNKLLKKEKGTGSLQMQSSACIRLGPPAARGTPTQKYVWDLSRGLNLQLRVRIIEYTRCNFDILLCISSFSLVMSVTDIRSICPCQQNIF